MMAHLSKEARIERNQKIVRDNPGKYDRKPGQRVKDCLNNLKGVIEAVEEDGVLILHRYTVRWDRGEIERRVEPTMLDAID
jgi:hypothetical protein